MWDVEFDLIIDWLDQQDAETIAGIDDAVTLLEREGPNLGRPLVDTIRESRLNNLKELRPSSPGRSEVRILFAFDPDRHAIFLVAGDKARGKNGHAKWNGWYRKAIPAAERIYRSYLQRKEGSQ